MLRFLHRLIKRLLILAVVVFAALFVWRGWDMRRGLPLEAWHTYELAEPDAEELERADWAHYLRAEEALFSRVRHDIASALQPDDRTHYNRYSTTSPVYPWRFARDWNRSAVMLPEGKPVGAAVLLHGLTDSPYSLRHIGNLYRERGFAVVSIRLPGHGTVPGSLKVTRLEQWTAATRLAVREARRLAGEGAPLHVVGYSNGGALALNYAIEALGDGALKRPDRLVLLSPMVGITPFARFTWLAGLPAVIPAFAQSAWLSILPEFNPFKYNSMPVNAAQRSFDMTQIVQGGLRRLDEEGRMAEFPPVLTFQSVFDFTVSTSAVITELYARLPANGSELVLFDPNFDLNTRFGAQVDDDTRDAILAKLPSMPRRFRTVLVTSADRLTSDMVARTAEAGATATTETPLALRYPPEVYSLSHIAVPFPLTDGLYGLTPDPADDFGIQTGVVNAWGEVGTFTVTIDPVLRMTSRMQSNPFFPLLVDGIGKAIARPAP
ncbi:alpha/beta hydrolase [Pseudochelatococcus lubricantis]|uniref:alpha/beta hydrolase n=1 Tax=Pseudochelatococcus lubricantis TaxID=1538102 RepID=UPI0035EE5E93